MRNINRPVADASGITKIVPVEQGGFGSTNADEAAANIAAASSSMLGLPNGLARLDEDGKVPLENFPSPTMFAPTLKGPTKVNPGERVVYEITNWEPGKTYTVSATAGSVSVAGNQVAFIAPKDFGIVGLSVGDRTVNVEITAILTNRPEIYVTDNHESAIVSVRLSNYDGDSRLKLDFSQFELRKGDEAKQFIVRDGDKISTVLTDLDNDTTYYIKGRHVTEEGVVSDWSREVSFRTAKEYKLLLRQILAIDENVTSFVSSPASDDEILFVLNYETFGIIKKIDGFWKVVKKKTIAPPAPNPPIEGAAISPETRCCIYVSSVSSALAHVRVINIDTFEHSQTTVSSSNNPGWADSGAIGLVHSLKSPSFIFIKPGIVEGTGYFLPFHYSPTGRSLTPLTKVKGPDFGTQGTNWTGSGSSLSHDGLIFNYQSHSGTAKTAYIYRRNSITENFVLNNNTVISGIHADRSVFLDNENLIRYSVLSESPYQVAVNLYRLNRDPSSGAISETFLEKIDFPAGSYPYYKALQDGRILETIKTGDEYEYRTFYPGQYDKAVPLEKKLSFGPISISDSVQVWSLFDQKFYFYE